MEIKLHNNQIIKIEDKFIHLEFIHASGPGGQNVNKVSSAVHLFFDLKQCPAIPADLRRRIEINEKSRINSKGIIIIKSKQFRTQIANRKAAFSRLENLILTASIKPKSRKKTNPTKASKRKRLDDKNRKKRKKSLRQKIDLNQPDF